MLRIQREMLIIIKKKTGLSGKKICEIMGYGENSIDWWINLKHSMPLVKMHEIITHFNLNYCEIYYEALGNMNHEYKRSA